MDDDDIGSKKNPADLETAANSGKGGSKRGKNGGNGSAAHKHREADIVEQCTKAYEENKRPRKLGKMFAFWYNGKNEPRIVVGPDFGFSLLEFVLTNGILGGILNSARS